ncbi:hypothetical protein LCGC14_1858470 [marine sediment metagenome]|uniref:Uncharacterized protein n=1 Tax=marine sediment metagenome TaxID=412755 RepID=A0A0F9J7A5_9ZZZZ
MEIDDLRTRVNTMFRDISEKVRELTLRVENQQKIIDAMREHLNEENKPK